MGRGLGVARLIRQAPEWDRFAHWPRAWAIAVLSVLAALMLAGALTYPKQLHGRGFIHPKGVSQASRDTDLMLYRAVAARVAKGENYYHAAFTEQRARGFPVTPGLAVRLPTLAFVTALLGTPGMVVLGALLALATLLAWWRRLGIEPGGREHRLIAMLFIVIGGAVGTKAHYSMLHEVWAGLLIALAFGLHRPGRWWWAWLAAAAALAVRELALPFVLLLGAMALWRRDWREAGAWAVLVVLFGLALAWHLSLAHALVLPSDKPGPAWLVFRGLKGWTANIVTSSSLYRLPHPLAAAVALLPLLGWAEWKSDAGRTGTLLHAGYGVFFMMAGRDNNFYWGLLVVPTWFLGLTFVPRALWSLGRNALGKT